MDILSKQSFLSILPFSQYMDHPLHSRTILCEQRPSSEHTDYSLYTFTILSAHGQSSMHMDNPLYLQKSPFLFMDHPLFAGASSCSLEPSSQFLDHPLSTWTIPCMKRHFGEYVHTWKLFVLLPSVNEYALFNESWCWSTLHEWMKIHFWKLKLSPLIRINLYSSDIYRISFESWSWCPLSVNENEYISMHLSKQAEETVYYTCDVWHEACWAR